MPAGRSGRRQIPPQDVARYWQSRASGMSMQDAAGIAGIHVNTIATTKAPPTPKQTQHKQQRKHNITPTRNQHQ